MDVIKLSKRELEVLKCLLENARYTYKEIEERTQIPDSTVIDIVRRLEKKGIVRGYTAIVDLAKLGFRTIGITNIKYKRDFLSVRDQLREAYSGPAAPEVLFSCVKTGWSTTMVFSIHKSPNDYKEWYNRLLQKMDNILGPGYVELTPEILLTVVQSFKVKKELIQRIIDGMGKAHIKLYYEDYGQNLIL